MPFRESPEPLLGFSASFFFWGGGEGLGFRVLLGGLGFIGLFRGLGLIGFIFGFSVYFGV